MLGARDLRTGRVGRKGWVRHGSSRITLSPLRQGCRPVSHDIQMITLAASVSPLPGVRASRFRFTICTREAKICRLSSGLFVLTCHGMGLRGSFIAKKTL